MKDFDKNQFDEIFRSGLTAPDLNEIDEDWSLMKARLQREKNRSKIPYLMMIVSSVAAILLLVFSVIFNAGENIPDQGTLDAKANKVQPVERVSPKDDEIAGAFAERPAHARLEIVEQSPDNMQAGDASIQTQFSEPVPELVESGLTQVNATNQSVISSNPETLSAQVQQPAEVSTEMTANSSTGAGMALSEDKAVSAETLESENQKSSNVKSRFSLAINFAPDINGVEQFQSSKLSYSIGAGLIYNISNKLSIEAGAAYGKKIYQTGFSSFRPASYNLFQVKPNIVSSGFDVMDIQLNLAYTMLKKGKSSIGFGAGISSYLMLDEHYSFTYQNANARGLSSFSTGYQNNHFFGIANLNLSYERSITNNIKLAFNPYLKLPLTDLGYGNIRLRSAGMSVGVITNLNKTKK